jgi:putative membrane protein
MLSIVVALMSPLDTLSDDLSWVHMTQHMVLMLIAAPLLVVSAPGLVVAWALPRSWRSALGQLFSGRKSYWGWTIHQLVWNSLWVWSLHAFVLWVWHIPWLYELALVDPMIHDLEHVSFFLAACLFWRIAIDRRRRPTLNPGWSVLYLFTTSLHATVLGVFMALAPSVWYPTYMDRTWRWGLSPLEDQQLAGLIMWMPACTVYAIVAAGLFANWLQELEVTPAGHGKHLPCTET